MFKVPLLYFRRLLSRFEHCGGGSFRIFGGAFYGGVRFAFPAEAFYGGVRFAFPAEALYRGALYGADMPPIKTVNPPVGEGRRGGSLFYYK